jgi:hypothetical protein
MAANTNTACHAARTGEGYWTCDHLGGCRNCRSLARSADDFDQLDNWDQDATPLDPTSKCGICGVTLDPAHDPAPATLLGARCRRHW